MNAPTGVAERLTGLVGALRAHGVRIGTGETVDAAQAVETLGLADRERLREGLAATLLHSTGQRRVFDPVFDLYFPRLVGSPRSDGRESDAPAADREELRDRLAAALAAGDREMLERLAIEAVDGFGGYGSSPGSDGWSSYQTLDRLRPQTLMARVRDSVRARQDGAAGFADRLLEDEIRRRIEMFRALVATEARRRVAERRGRDELARRAVAPTADRVDFLFAGRDRLAELRRTAQPLARKLATRIAARRRRAARGTIDLRRTLRGSLSTGGVPMRPVLRRRRPVRPELVLLCDVSGSVAGFSDFTMLLVQALHDQFSKVRVFAFVNRIDEVTGLLVHGAADPEGLGARIRSEATLTGWHDSSDYGAAFGEFAERYVDAVGPRSTVFVLGDARTNMGDPNLPAVRRLSERARRVYWLNPEPLSQWGTGDSAAPEYAGLVEMHECRNVRQLSELIGRLLPV
ncbi:VWA domain-containing protein [Streptomyces sp. NBC_01340]|uniref:VWA domain-containing protein n=1 Tax=unclassified Streptomyces TaxID=2593676 RepID=UPI002252916E|nr:MULTISPECIES: VWA domain-containing protein [unclassified Streptomyces]MCX4458333.1 VWA domain-containing protein [Streptomyces sp. NBC_01719]MCX4497690.1 VWA domain-containing protein [Streptomyces sp. NBC_01728]WSI42511.1 VWA domain-containing protein [Streptomyces sp. NBC_01340]